MENITNTFNGSLEVITGPMFSGKSTELLRRLSCDTAALKKGSIYINHSNDTRTTTGYSTHNPYHSGSLPGIDKLSLSELPSLETVYPYHTIGIDEAQFFSNLDIITEYVEKLNKRVIVGKSC